MKKLILILGVICSAGAVKAQTVKVGIVAGANFSKLSSKSGGETASTGNLTGFHVGGVVDLDFGAVSLQPGLIYSSKGGKETASMTVTSGSTTTTASGYTKVKLDYLEVPVNVLYNIPVSIGKIFVGGGPYAAFGVSGKAKTEIKVNGQVQQSAEEDVDFGSGDDQVKNPDFGINLKAGIRLNSGIAVNAGYGLGLANLSNDSNGSTKNRVLSVGLGFFF